MLRRQALFVTLALVILAVPAEAQRSRWTTLNTTSVRPGVTSETLWVRNRDGLREARLCIERRSVRITGVRIDFDRGVSQRVPVLRTIRPGECSLAVSLRNGGRDRIRSVRLDLARLAAGPRPFIRLEAR
jgi:hypothetical protein